MGFLSAKRTMKDTREQAVPYPALGMIIRGFAIKSPLALNNCTSAQYTMGLNAEKAIKPLHTLIETTFVFIFVNYLEWMALYPVGYWWRSQK
jgi:hypothetical protein